jgi:ATP-dependent DNA ligase
MRWHSTGPVRHPPGFVEPCLPTNGHAAPTGPQWVYEIKHDGFRFVCRRDGGWCSRGEAYAESRRGVVRT